ncbi:MAG: LCP family protein [Mycobacterium leprae]
MQAPTPVRKAKRRRSRVRYWMRRLLFLLILLLPFGIWWGWSAWRHLPLQAEGNAPRIVSGQPIYVAVMGVDERKDDVGRSDTLMLVRLDPKANKLDVISIPRDTRITYDTGKQSKINAAYSIGGPDLTTQVLSTLLDIPRPYYLKVNFQAFQEIVDQIGGVEIDVDKHYTYSDPYQNLYIDIPAGHQVMLGDQALKYVRMRYDGVTNSDIARVSRQQQFLKALKDKLSSPYYVTRVPALVDILRTYVTTNIPEADQLKLAQALFKARGALTTSTLPGTDAQDKSGDWLIDTTAWKGVTATWQTN